MTPRLRRLTLTALPLALLGAASSAPASDGVPAGEGLGRVLPLSAGLPFGGMLLSIAVLPLLAPRFWHHHFGKVTAFWGLVFAVPFVVFYRGAALFEIYHVCLADYLPFLLLLWTLYTLAGGILVTGSLSGSPAANGLLLLVGTFAASVVGTTGAAMLLIRPFLRANAWRKRRDYQVVFFIFLVCNVGGALTPLGDPPLFLGFLHGVPFFWTLKLFRPMLLVGGLVLATFLALDTVRYRREEGRPPEAVGARLRVEGGHNLAFLLAVVAAVLAGGLLDLGRVSLLGAHRAVADVCRDALLVALGLASLATTRREVRERNDFSWAPIREVAILFAGIFVTMIPVTLILKAGVAGPLASVVEAVETPAHCFWAAGILSSLLDNAPTYLVFLHTALGRFSPGVPEREAIAALIRDHGVYLQALSAGAVFMGANTYIGNAPNFMVRSMAEEAGVEMPSFFGYIFKYSVVFLVPSFLVVTWVFFR